ncbi:hypothetical protein ACWGDX_19500 [Streptomyces sp. NPDC055025]
MSSNRSIIDVPGRDRHRSARLSAGAPQPYHGDLLRDHRRLTALGPPVGGFLTQWTWRAIFWIIVPIAIAAVIIVSRAAMPQRRHRERIDWVGATVVAAGMGLVILGI